MTDDPIPTFIQLGDQQVDASMVTLPESGRRFRNAWIDAGEEAIGVDMDMAREIARNEIRAKREEAFKRLDVEYMRALERGEDTGSIVERKLFLREAPADPRIDEAEDDVELAQVLDGILDDVEHV